MVTAIPTLLVGLLAGAIGGMTIARQITAVLEPLPEIPPPPEKDCGESGHFG